MKSKKQKHELKNTCSILNEADQFLHDMLTNPDVRHQYIKLALNEGDSPQTIKAMLNGLNIYTI